MGSLWKDYKITEPLDSPEPRDEKTLFRRLTWGSRASQAMSLMSFYVLSRVLDGTLTGDYWIIPVGLTLPMLSVIFFFYTHEAYKGLFHIYRTAKRDRILRFVFEAWLVLFFLIGVSEPATNYISATNDAFRFWYGFVPVPFFLFGEFLLSRIKRLRTA